MVCRSFCLQTWIKALNVAGVDPNSELRNPEKVFYLPIIKARPISQPFINTSALAPRGSMRILSPDPTLLLLPKPNLPSSNLKPLLLPKPNPLSNNPSPLLLPSPSRPSWPLSSPILPLPKALRWEPRHLQ